MDEIVKTCCFTGPRPKNYPWGNDKECEAKIVEKLKAAVQKAIERGYRHFISGMSAGIDLLAAKIVLQLRGDMPKMEITLEAAIPFLFQFKRWKEETKREYEVILSQCDKVHYIADAFSLEAYKKRDKYMVDKSSLLIAVEGKPNGGTTRTIMYANELGRTIELICL